MNISEHSTPSLNLNSSLPSSTLVIQKEWTVLQMLLALILGAVTVATIFGNLLVLYGLYLFKKAKRSLRSPTHCLISNLAIADLAVGVIVMPGLFILTLNGFKWYWGDIICSLVEHIHFALCATSMLSMMTIGLERYIGVRYSLRHKRILSKGRLIKIVIMIWLLAIALTSIPLTIWPKKGPRPVDQCPVNLRSDFIFFISVSVYVIPVLTTAYIYWLIYRKAVQLFMASELGIKGDSNANSAISSTQSNGNSYTSTSTAKTKRLKSEKSDEQKLIKTRKKQTVLAKKLSYVVVTMLLLFGPLFILFFTIGIMGPWFITPNLLFGLGWLRYCNSTVNPYIYIFIIPGYKRAFLKIFWNEKNRGRSNEGNGKLTSETNTNSRSETSSNDNNSNTHIVKGVTQSKNSTSSPTSSTKVQPDLRGNCSNCGTVGITLGNLDTACTACEQKVTIYKPKVRVSFSDELPNFKSRGETVNPMKKDNRMTESPMSQDVLLNEIRNFLRVNQNQNDTVQGYDSPESDKSKQVSQLVSNLAMVSPIVQLRGENKLQNTMDRGSVEQLQSSLLKPIKDRRSQMINSTGFLEIDQQAMKELDDIIAQLERPLNL